MTRKKPLTHLMAPYTIENWHCNIIVQINHLCFEKVLKKSEGNSLFEKYFFIEQDIEI